MTNCTHYDLVEFGAALEERTTPLRAPAGEEVLLEVICTGVCHSDLHIIDGEFDLGEEGVMRMADRGMKLPRTLGHETVGRVSAVGPDADTSMIGQKMLVFPWLGCGSCRPCHEGRSNDCMAMRIIGLVQDGGYASHMLVENAEALVDCDGLDPATVASHACSGLTVYNALGKLDPPHPESWLAILGVGGLGLNAVAIAAAMGYRNILAADINEANLKAARDIGASVTLNTRADDALDRLRELTGGQLTDVLDTVGAPQTARLAVHGLIKGGRYVVVGLHGGDFKMPQPWLPQKAMTVMGSHVGTRAQLQDLIALVRSGKVKPLPVECRPMDAINDALSDLHAGRVTGRVVLTN
ncbi:MULTISPECIES: alcohol dehydrogenase [unclassified Roseovarius]|uniref:alcohol dehydrogenase n=1 Tax=unclassified Roseovarius TaxID=2614913 RepID=UPI002740195B|nr:MULTISPECIES: alcohol dehydrogenase [unclassified Roseovarius]